MRKAEGSWSGSTAAHLSQPALILLASSAHAASEYLRMAAPALGDDDLAADLGAGGRQLSVAAAARGVKVNNDEGL